MEITERRWGRRGRTAARAALLLLVLATLPGAARAGQQRGTGPAPATTPGRWTLTGAMSTGRAFFTATLLPTGQVLAAGGAEIGSSYGLTSADLYDPHTQKWTPTGALNYGRQGHTATLLRSGQVLVAGGSDLNLALGSAELYDPATGTFSYTVTGMTTIRVFHTATLLEDGQVLVTGGCSGQFFACVYTWNSADLYDPATQTFTATGAMSQARMFHTATLLPGGQVLVAGGSGCGGCGSTNVAELYTPQTGTFTPTRGLMLASRALHTATLLKTGQVLLAGGCTAVNGPGCSGTAVLSSAELYNPRTGTFRPTGSLHVARFGQTATLLPNGEVLVAGGQSNSTTSLNSAELYNPQTGMWTLAASMHELRSFFTATLLAGGGVLVAGGCGRPFNGGECAGDSPAAEIFK